MSIRRPVIAFAMGETVRPRVFTDDRIREFGEIADIAGYLTEYESDAARSVLAEVDVLVTGWGAPPIDDAVLAAAPRLEAVLHAAGSVKAYLGSGVLERGIRVSTAAAANAVPVAEYTVAMILLAGKKVLPIAARYRTERDDFDVEAAFPGMGNYGQRVGIVGASKIGRLVIEMLRPYAFEVVVYDPFLSQAGASELGVHQVALDELLATSDIVSIHAPSLPSTFDLVDARGIGLMRRGATLVNTARGEIVDQAALTRRVVSGELFTILDVTVPWILEPEHPLYSSDNAFLTPHVAGSLGAELGRLAEVALDELRRLVAGRPLEHEVEAELLAITA
ncbi:phosphoglycerate dehydrogenase-like enzyme [Microbacterium natoriense]|uniref:Phosphoglycerate dehydrogenase-like enzyme n=1 Tax=Microbacterium natoriense TaxID=284570 RepID=A0AAW8EW98_9MICO|nr:hydroxyacid dehydrogenase [Microbacterium natoriense]MDQ0646486.1 phosphoglycerate dehydrogenase-like enzyme [Microbacterium natoriense]